jgi:hypothetical protein
VLSPDQGAHVEGSLSPQELILRWLVKVGAYPTLPDYTRSFVDLPDADAPLSRLMRDAASAVRTGMKGKPRDDVHTAVRRAVGDVVFLFALVFVVNQSAVHLSTLLGLQASAITFWMGCLLGGPRDQAERPPDAEQAAAWRSWFATLDVLLDQVDGEVAAWQSLEERYLGGHSCLFVDAAADWARLEGHLELLERIASKIERPATPDVDAPSSAGLDAEDGAVDRARPRAGTRGRCPGEGDRDPRRAAARDGDHGAPVGARSRRSLSDRPAKPARS